MKSIITDVQEIIEPEIHALSYTNSLLGHTLKKTTRLPIQTP